MSDDTTQDQNTATKEPKAQVPANTSDGGNVSEATPEAGKAKVDSSEVSKAEEAPKARKEISANLEKIIESIGKLSVLELADLVHALEDKFGVTAAPPAAVAPSASSGQAAQGEPAEEQTSFNVILTGAGANKISVIKAVRELVPTLGLKEAKDLVEAAPKPVMEGVNKATANEAKAKLTAAGATVELQ